MGDGPSDPGLWITRKLGHFEREIFGDIAVESAMNDLQTTCIQSDHIDPRLMERAYRAVIFNQPQLRADVRKGEDGDTYFTPATDFSDVFQFIDQSGEGGVRGYAGCWDFAEELVCTPFPTCKGKPPHKCYLVKRPDCYIMINVYHHGIGDGTSGFIIIKETLRQYNLLISGQEVDLCPLSPLPSDVDMFRDVKVDEILEEIKQKMLTKVGEQKSLLPLDMEEIAAAKKGGWYRNRTLHAMGSKVGCEELKKVCKSHGVTVGCYGAAALIHALSAVYIKRNGGQFPKHGLPSALYPPFLTNMRKFLNPSPSDYVMVFIGTLGCMKVHIGEDTTIMETAGSIGKQLKRCLSEKWAPMIIGNEEYFENMPNLPLGRKNEFFLSSKGIFSHPTEFSWGQVKSIHSMGCDWSPKYANQTVLFHTVNGVVDYTVVCCDGKNNVADAREVFDLFVNLMENSGRASQDCTVMDVVKHFG